MSSTPASLEFRDVLNGDLSESYEFILTSPSRDLALIKKTRKRIDRELVNLNILKAHRNALAPISRLPPELLSQIFMYVCGREDWWSYDGQPRFYRGSMAWIKVAGICRHWRTVALQCPMLWVDLCLSDYHLTRKMLRRSQNLPVTVIGDLADHYRTRKTQSAYLALEHRSRIRALHIRGPSIRLGRFFSKMTGPYPLLESLCVSFYDRNEDELMPLPGHLFRGNMPQLRRLQLYRCSLDWDSPDFSQLTHMEIHGSSRSIYVDMGLVVNVLRTIPALVTLCLVKCVMPTYTMVSIPEPLVMNHLSHLRLDTTSFRLLWEMRFRALASLGLHTPIILSSAELTSLLNTVTSHFAGMSANDQLRSLLVEARPNFILMRGWTAVQWCKLHQVIMEPMQLDLELCWRDGSQEKDFEIIMSLLKRLPVVKLEQLELHMGSLSPDSVSRWTTKVWMELFKGSAVQCVRLHRPGEAIFNLITALIPGYEHMLANAQSPDYEPLPDPEMFLPDLTQIWIISTDFSQSIAGTSFLPILVSVLCQMRLCMGEAMESMDLIITDCSNISEADVMQLKQIMPVVWDGEDTAQVAQVGDDDSVVMEYFSDDFRYSEEEGEDF
jgi:hypothetical protein